MHLIALILNAILTTHNIDSCLTNPITNPADLLIPDNDTVVGDIETRRTRQEADGSPAYDNDNLGYTIAQSPGKGMGVFATRFIPAGSKILDEKPVLTLPAGGDGAGKQMLRPSDLQAFIAQVFGLSPALRQAVVNLQGERVALWKPQMEHYRQILGREEFPVVGDTADGGVIARRPLSVDERAQLEHILRVFYTNAAALVAPVQVAPLHPPPSLSLSFQSSAPQRTAKMAHVGDGLFLTFSRINHSCEANAVWDTCRQPGIMSIRAARDIRPGEEITISYFWETAETVEKRRERTKGWGFVCQCLKCGPLGEQWS